jgi:tetratricopeptide (TPR) repeat protein
MPPMSTPRYRTTTLDAIDEISVVGGSLRWKPVRRTLGIGAFGINAYVGDAGRDVVEEHDEVSSSGTGGHQELYVVVRGHARFTIDGEEVDAPAGTLVFLPEPEARRAATALQDGTTVLAIGGDPEAPYAVSPWEYNFAAEADVARGDYAAAAATVREALPAHEGNASIHYNLACFLARDGRADDALAELRRAYDADPEQVARWAADDEDLAPLRGMGGFPPLGPR